MSQITKQISDMVNDTMTKIMEKIPELCAQKITEAVCVNINNTFNTQIKEKVVNVINSSNIDPTHVITKLFECNPDRPVQFVGTIGGGVYKNKTKRIKNNQITRHSRQRGKYITPRRKLAAINPQYGGDDNVDFQKIIMDAITEVMKDAGSKAFTGLSDTLKQRFEGDHFVNETIQKGFDKLFFNLQTDKEVIAAMSTKINAIINNNNTSDADFKNLIINNKCPQLDQTV